VFLACVVLASDEYKRGIVHGLEEAEEETSGREAGKVCRRDGKEDASAPAKDISSKPFAYRESMKQIGVQGLSDHKPIHRVRTSCHAAGCLVSRLFTHPK
jgi:hypothetical protein